ncbi:hypothetical protein Pan258_07250 [Symmachiella dynata]|nr:hypothetical protein Pan258_07250 [Symmachiella dynata]
MACISAGEEVAGGQWPVARKKGGSFGMPNQIAKPRQPYSLMSTAYRLTMWETEACEELVQRNRN